MIAREQNSSIWQKSPRLEFPSLNSSIRADVCIIGAGIAGLSTAYRLVNQGFRVVVLDSQALGSGQSGRTTAHLTHAMDDRFFHLVKLYGANQVKRIAESHTAAIDQIEEISKREGISCDFARVDGFLILGPEDDIGLLDQEYSAAFSAGLHEVELVERVPLMTEGRVPAIRFPEQGQMNPMKYLTGLASAITRKGGRVFTRSPVVDVRPQPRGNGNHDVEVLTQNGYRIDAAAAVVATHVPMNVKFGVHVKQFAYRTYVVGIKMSQAPETQALIWDTARPYHYVRTYDDLLIVGGQDHKTGQTDQYSPHFGALEDWARSRFSGLGEVKFQWSGQIIEPMDDLAYIGRSPGEKNIYVATGDSGQGMTHGTIAGILIGDLISGKSNPWADLYDPTRFTLRAAPALIGETINTAAQYMDWLRGGDPEVENLKTESGTIIRMGTRRIAVYRDAEGEPHALSANCTHLHGSVRWNATEKTWDCPCHGSRFDRFGHVIEGPAVSDLKRLDRDETTEEVPKPEPLRASQTTIRKKPKKAG